MGWIVPEDAPHANAVRLELSFVGRCSTLEVADVKTAQDDDYAWIDADGGWIEGDIIRWHEPVLLGKGKNPRREIGGRTLTAQVLDVCDLHVDLATLRCEVTSRTRPRRATTSFVVAADTEIRRTHHTLVEGRPERALWLDEVTRAALADETDRDVMTTPVLN
jgi:hypothetical protein